MKATWTKDKKNEGEYLVRIVLSPNDPDVTPGMKVRVQKKNGAAYQVTISRVLWAGAATEKDHEFDPTIRRGDLMVLAKPEPREKKSARAMATASETSSGFGGSRPETDDPANEDDIPF